MILHPSFNASKLSEKELVKRLSINCVSVTSIDLHKYRTAHELQYIINALSTNTRVRKVSLNLRFFNEDLWMQHTLITWLRSRGDKCDLALDLNFRKMDDQLVAEHMLSLFSSAETPLNIRKLSISGNREVFSAMYSSFIIEVLSLLSTNTLLNIGGDAATFILLHIHHVPKLPVPLRGIEVAYMMPDHVSQSFLSDPNTRRLHFSSDCSTELDSLCQDINTYHSQDGSTLNELSLTLSQCGIPNGRLAMALARIPPRLVVDICLYKLATDDGPLATQALMSVQGLRKIELVNHGDTQADWVNGLQELFHSRLQVFKLVVERLESALCLTSLRSSILESFHLVLLIADESLDDILYTISDVIPTMVLLKDLSIHAPKKKVRAGVRRNLQFPVGIPTIRNKQEHDEFMNCSNSEHLHRYIAYDNLVEAVCRSPSITSCSISNLSKWQSDRMAFAIQSRVVRVNTLLLSTTETPLSLLPLALSTLSAGHCYDIMAYIVRQKSDQLMWTSGM